MTYPGEYYERGLLHPEYDDEAATPWLAESIDPSNDGGTVSVPQGPGLGYDFDREFVDANPLGARN